VFANEVVAELLQIFSVARVPAADIEAVVVKLLKEHLATKQDRSTTSNVLSEDRGAVAQLVAGIVVHARLCRVDRVGAFRDRGQVQKAQCGRSLTSDLALL
jgi:hypothetical protein